MIVNDRIVVSESNLKGFNTGVMEDTNLLASMIYQDLREISTGSRYRSFSPTKIAFEYFQGDKYATHNILRAIRNIEKNGYIGYKRQYQHVPPKFIILKDIEPNADVDLRWMSVQDKFGAINLLVLTTIDSLEEATTNEIANNNPEIARSSISKELIRLRNRGILKSVPANKKENLWSLNLEKLTLMEGLQMSSNIAKLLELKEIYARRAEQAQDAVKFYEEELAKELKKTEEETK